MRNQKIGGIKWKHSKLCDCAVCKPDSGYDIEMIKIREEQEKNEIRIDEYFAKEAAKRSKKKS